MSTLAQVTSRILDDLNNPSLTAQAVQQVQLAIQAYKSTPFWWNEGTTTLSVSQAYIAVPSDYVFEVGLNIVLSGIEVPLEKAQTSMEIFNQRPTTGGRPTLYAYFGNRLEFNRSADQVYVMVMRYLKELTTLSATSDSNSWIAEAEDLIVYRAEKMLFASVIRDTGAAQAAAALEKQAYDLLARQRDQRIGTGYAKPWYP